MVHLRVVLVEPQIPANLGFLARVLENFGVEDWVAVGGCPVAGTEAEKTGAPALARLQSLKRADSLQEALDDSVGAIGFTARGGHRRHPDSVEEVFANMRGIEGSDQVLALVFGREDRGLENAECALCSQLATIPTVGLSSLNLSHAVAVVLYEWSRNHVALDQHSLPAQWSTLEERQRAMERAHRVLEQVAFPYQQHQLMGTLQRFAAQPMESRDLRMLNRILRHAEFLLSQS